MACAPGGAFILGSTHYFPISADPVPEHLVQLSPFAIDVDEVSVGQIRPLVQAGMLRAPATGDPDNALPPECTFPLTNADGSMDAYPVNCVSWTTADSACRLLGKRLPTEAEWEYVAGGLGAKHPFPWGADTNICHYAVVSSGRALIAQVEPFECLVPPNPPGPHRLDGSGLDVVAAGVPSVGGQVRNMGGNVNEWVADVFDSYSGPCWQGSSQLLVNPVCRSALGSTAIRAIRGGSWQLEALSAYVFNRNSFNASGIAAATGFRCAISM
jgi:formylglycine-generating enzyme required for sulfatase activity